MNWLHSKFLSFFMSVIKFINGDETAISRYFDRNRERKGFQGFDSAAAHFTTSAEVGSIEWEEAKMEAVDQRWEQEKRYWLGYRLGNTKVEVGREPLSVMSPGWEYHKGRTFAVWEEVAV